MKKKIQILTALFSVFALSVVLLPSNAAAFYDTVEEAQEHYEDNFVDYGVSDRTGTQCHDESCDIVYTSDLSCIMDAKSFRDQTCKLIHVSDNVESIRKGIRDTILRILSAK